MNAALIDSVFADQDTDAYFYVAVRGDKMVSGGDIDKGDLMNLLILVYDNMPEARIDLVDFANTILQSTGS
jgi:hypothetical protein